MVAHEQAACARSLAHLCYHLHHCPCCYVVVLEVTLSFLRLFVLMEVSALDPNWRSTARSW